MMKYKTPIVAIAAACALGLGLVGPASAQFVGDVFFVDPAIAVKERATGELELAIFVGDQAFGVTRAEVLYDETKLEVVDVAPVAVGTVLPVLRWETGQGTLKLIVVNGQSRKVPIGSVSLARIQFRALGTAGEQTLLTSRVSQAFSAERTAYRAGTGFGAEVSIDGASGTVSRAPNASVTEIPKASAFLEARALRLRPPGHIVRMHVADQGTFREIRVQIPSAEDAKD